MWNEPALRVSSLYQIKTADSGQRELNLQPLLFDGHIMLPIMCKDRQRDRIWTQVHAHREKVKKWAKTKNKATKTCKNRELASADPLIWKQCPVSNQVILLKHSLFYQKLQAYHSFLKIKQKNTCTNDTSQTVLIRSWLRWQPVTFSYFTLWITEYFKLFSRP